MFAWFFPRSRSFDVFWDRVARHAPFSTSVLHKYLVKSLQAGDPLARLDEFRALAECAAPELGTQHMYV